MQWPSVNMPQQQNQSPLQTLQQLMMMKMQHEQEQKNRQQEVKDQMERIDAQYQREKDMIKYKARMDADIKKEELEGTMNRSLGAIQEAKNQFMDTSQMGPFQGLPQGQQFPIQEDMQIPLGVAEMFARSGQEIPISLGGRMLGPEPMTPYQRENLAFGEKELGFRKEQEKRRSRGLDIREEKLEGDRDYRLKKLENDKTKILFNIAKDMSPEGITLDTVKQARDILLQRDSDFQIDIEHIEQNNPGFLERAWQWIQKKDKVNKVFKKKESKELPPIDKMRKKYYAED